MVSTHTLQGVAAMGGMAVAIAGLMAMRAAGDDVRRSPYYTQAIKELETSASARALMGQPLKCGRFELGDQSGCFCDGKSAQFRVPVAGPKAAGQYWFWAERETEGWKVTRAELELAEDSTKRLVIVKEVTNPSPQS